MTAHTYTLTAGAAVTVTITDSGDLLIEQIAPTIRGEALNGLDAVQLALIWQAVMERLQGVSAVEGALVLDLVHLVNTPKRKRKRDRAADLE